MPSFKSIFISQAQFEAGVVQGLFGRSDITKTYLALCNSLSGGSFLWDETSDLGTVLATELTQANGYNRMRVLPGSYRTISAAATATGLLTLAGGVSGYANDTPVFPFATGTSAVLAPFVAGTIYYARDVDTVNNQLKLAATPGGSVILPTTTTITGNNLALAGSYNATTKKWTTVEDSVILTASGGSLSYTDVVLINDQNSTWSNYQITALDTATGTFTTLAPHGLTTSDSLFFTADSGGTLPTVTTPSGVSLASNRIFKVLTPSGSTFKASVDGTTAVTFSSSFTGTLRVRNGSGRIVSFLREDTDPAIAARVIAPGITRSFGHKRSLTLNL